MMLAPTHSVDGLVEHLGDVKFVMHNGCIRRLLACGRRKTGAHIHGGSLNFLALLAGQRAPQLAAALRVIARNNLQHSRFLQIGHDRDVILP